MAWGDSRDVTFLKRKHIGFVNAKEEWRQATAFFNEDSLSICGHPVMQDWEDGYMRQLADIATINLGRVLEVGFGLGISAAYIQQHSIKDHVIIEANNDVYQRLEEFAAGASRPVRAEFGFWEDVVPQFPDEYFDGILFDTYPLNCDEVHRNHFYFFDEAYRLLKPSGCLTYYSDEPASLSKEHIEALEAAGFQRQQISWRVCEVNPPKDCQYWQFSTMTVPIISKS